MEKEPFYDLAIVQPHRPLAGDRLACWHGNNYYYGYNYRAPPVVYSTPYNYGYYAPPVIYGAEPGLNFNINIR